MFALLPLEAILGANQIGGSR